MELTENIYENAFYELMKILMTQNNEIFDMIALERPFFEFRGHKFDLRNMTQAWKICLTQHINKFQPTKES